MLAISHGAHALGFVSDTLTGAGAIGDDEIQSIVAATPPTFSTVLLTSEEDPAAVVRHQRKTRSNTLQLVGPIRPEGLRELRDALPGIALIKVIHVEDAASIDVALSYSDVADALLLDTRVKVGDREELGGTGVIHDWSISRQIVETSRLPVFLAGGLSPENVTEGIRRVSPFGVDVCSSLRPHGHLEPDRLRDFVANATGTLR